MKTTTFLSFFLVLQLLSNYTQAQSILNPNDPLVDYDSTNLPQQPVYGQIGRWIRTKSMSWNSDSYKAYIYEGSCFRLKFPKTYNPAANDGKKYPIALVFHGGGEAGPITDNETQLYHGGRPYMNAADSGVFDGYVLFMQSQGFWGTTSYTRIIDIINYMIANNKLDPFCISANGLSSGGQASWDMVFNYPQYTSASMPMSNVSVGYKNISVVNNVKFTPMWNFQGSLDGSPAPSTAHQVNDAMVTAGADYHYSEYIDVAHNTWDSAFAEPDFFKFMLRGYSSNPWTLFGKTGFCDSTLIDATLGLPPGFNQYQWRKNGVVITGAASNTLHVTTLGKYDARVLRNTTWSDWSRIPVTIQINPPTVTPPIIIAGIMSKVIADGSGKNYVNLTVPDNGYTSYTWKKVGSDSILSTDKIYKATQPGQYIVAVTQKYGCSSVYSPGFTVIDATGLNAPPPATNVVANSISSTQILLNWENNPRPVNNETAFEVYRSISQNGGFTYIGSASADTLNYADSKLSPGIQYFYKIRAVNNNGASALSNITSANTSKDSVAPAAPDSLKIVYATNSSIKLQWNSSNDNVGVSKYDVYINGSKAYSTTDTSFIINALQTGKIYSFYIKAVDSSNNVSVQSNLASSPTVLNGLIVKYYEGYWEKTPNFNTLTPLNTTVVNNINLNLSKRAAQFGFLWQGFIKIPADGTYKFQTVSDDGSMLWLTTYKPTSKPLVSNEGVRSIQKAATASVTLKKGTYPITISYYQTKNNKYMSVLWSNAGVFGDTLMHVIDDKYFTGNYIAVDSAPLSPANLSASSLAYNKIKITWIDKSNNETSFQVYRSLSVNGAYKIVNTTQPNATQFTDSALNGNTTYYYKINAVNSYGTSPNSNTAFAATANLSAPTAPSNLNATTLSSSAIQLKWNDVANEINYQIFRSVTDTFNFKLAATLPANSTSFIDSALYGNVAYFYKVKSVNSNKVLSVNLPAIKATTKNSLPVIINKITQKSIRYGSASQITITALDSDGDMLKFTSANLPVFAVFADNNNKTATLTLNPTSKQTGTFNNIKIFASDSLGGKDSMVFNLIVSSNYNPVIDSIANYTINEGDNLTIKLTGNDSDAGDSLRWSVSNVPKNYSLNIVNKKTANLLLNPDYTTAGNYLITVNVNDGHNSTDQKQFLLTVLDKDPNQIVYVRFKDQDSIGSPWNNITTNNSVNFKDNSGRGTSIGLNMQPGWFATWHEGPQTGNNSGIYPDAVLKDYYYFGTLGGPETVTNKIIGLDTSKSYTITFYSGSVWSQAANNGTTVYTIGSQSKSLQVQNNTTGTADFTNIKPASDGTIAFTLSKGINTTSGYLNAIVVKSLYQDILKPAAPQSLIAENVSIKGVKLSWSDVAYNESGYQVFRSINNSTAFKLISSLPFNSTTFTDTTLAGNTTYYYAIKAINANGTSGYSNIINITTPNRVPQINPVADVTIKNNQQKFITVTATDDAADNLKLTATGLPSFITFTDNSNKTGTLNILPSTGITGTFNITVVAKDKSDSSVSTSFNVTITDKGVNSIYINFSSGDTASGYWNNFIAFPSAGTTFSNLKDDNNSITAVSLKLKNGFAGQFSTGMQPENGQNIYPEEVLRSGLSESSNKIDSILITGLSVGKKYSFIFFNSHEDGTNGSTNFEISGKKFTLNAAHNINKTVQVNGIVTDANGQVTIKVSKATGANSAYLNALVIQSYDSAQDLLSPYGLQVTNLTRSSVGLQWADRCYNETGYEVWRADDSLKNYKLITTLAVNSTNYTDANLYADKTYYYVVRAVNKTSASDYSIPVAAITYSQAVYVNFTFSNDAGVPWNNTNALPELGDKWENLFDDSGIPSSINLEITGIFAGLYNAGMNTGNNTGIYPDKVIQDNYGLFTGQSASLKISGLNESRKYDFTFFASSQAAGDVNTVYTINNKKTILNASLNIDGTVTIYNVSPDVNGEATIMLSSATLKSQYGLIGALIIQEHKLTSTDSVPTPSAKPVANGPSLQLSVIKPGVESSEFKNVNIFPNPFTNYFTTTFILEQNADIEVVLYNASGSAVYEKKYNNLCKGSNALQITPGKNISSGIYIMKVLNTNGKNAQTFKVLKQ